MQVSKKWRPLSRPDWAKCSGVAALCLLPWLSACQTTPQQMPVAEPAPSQACQWPVVDGAVSLADVVAVLEGRDFLVRDTDTALGVVSAEKTERTTYHNADAVRPRLGGFVLGGSGGHVGAGVGVGFGSWGWGGSDDATRVERVSVALTDQQVQLTRDIRLFDWTGQLRESRTASDASFCTSIRQQLASQAGVSGGIE
ncbi:hypothetical protein KUW18_16325 [Halomonas sp. DP5Y7-2]|uniref:hypothetical protein n=1 Tax=Halomonas sp. DP5Y7-2 TaxID=2859076 RepID=UPI001C99F187|nr:hypothetical protein [Halomonas sp. DP5Y7-2]MBY5985659.1 hypothetical protein [Halomonas sp. DP5Y7-2]